MNVCFCVKKERKKERKKLNESKNRACSKQCLAEAGVAQSYSPLPICQLKKLASRWFFFAFQRHNTVDIEEKTRREAKRAARTAVVKGKPQVCTVLGKVLLYWDRRIKLWKEREK